MPASARRLAALRSERACHYDIDVRSTRMAGSGDKSPIFIPGTGTGALCLHGFTGTPYEVAPLARALGAVGFAVSAPLLAGHGESALALAATRWADWLASAEAALDRLRAATDGGKVAIAGFSMGGLLALRLARTRPESVAALALLSVPLRLPGWRGAVLRGCARLPGFLRRNRLAMLRKREGSDVTDPKVHEERPSYPEMPLGGLGELVLLADVVRRDLSLVTVPALVAHGERDRTVPQSVSFELAGCLASATVERLWLPRSGHLLAVDVEQQRLCAAVTAFFTRHATLSRAPDPSKDEPRS